MYVNASQTWPDDNYINRVYDDPQVSSAGPYLGKDIPPPARDAWLTAHLKIGTWFTQVVKDGNIDRVDATRGFSASFTPTMFIHGSGDTFTESRISERAYEKLKGLGVDTRLLLVPGAQHLFDLSLKEEDDGFREYVMEGFMFLAEKVGFEAQE
jgi:acetyl esterase/lipase